jgi:hypothetical protein
MRVVNSSALKNSNTIMLFGQSNAAGNQSTSDTGIYPSRKGQYIYSAYYKQWQPLKQNYNNGGTYDNYVGSVGCEMRLMELLSNYFKSDQYLIKYAAGGTSLDLGDDSILNWSPLSAQDKMFQGSVLNYRAAMNSFPAQRVKPKVLIWIQGENDSGSDLANRYKANFTTFINAMKNRYDLPNLKVLQTLLADTQTAYSGQGKTILNNEKKLYSVDGNKYINIDGADCPGGVHFSAAGQLYIAEKIFPVLLTMI